MLNKNIYFVLIMFIFNSCHSQIKNQDLSTFKKGLGNFSKKDSANHFDAINFNLSILKNDTIINHKKFYPLKLQSEFNLRNNIKYYLNYNKEGISIYSILNNNSQERYFLRFDNNPSDMITTLYGRFEFFQLVKQDDFEYNFQYIQNPYQIELYYMYGDKIIIKSKDDKKITLVLFYHDKFDSFQKEIEIPYESTLFY